MTSTQFSDYHNRTWDLSLSIPRLRIIKNELGIDLLNLHKAPEILEQLQEDPVFMVDLISILITDEIKKANLTAETFAAGLVNAQGQCQPVTDACNALLESITIFSPPAKARVIREIWTKAQTLTQTTLTHMGNKSAANYDRIESAVLKKVDDEFEIQMQKIFGTSSGTGAESSDSPGLTPIPSDSST